MGFAACSDDEVGFDVPVEFQRITFDPVPGGAVMRYKLPTDLDIFRVRARYQNAFGEELLKDASYLSDSVLLGGFTEARTDVPLRLSFLNKEMVESESIDMTFSTEAAATVALFDGLTVNPFWGGFNVTYMAPETVDGTIHVFYIGTNPATQQLDSILMGSYPITEGGDTLNFEVTQALAQLDVVVRTDDYDGHRVKMEIYRDVPALAMDTLLPEEFNFDFTGNVQGEGDYAEGSKYGFGRQFLFDGKKKGDGFRSHKLVGENRVYDTFMAGPEAFGERFIFDLRAPKVPAALLGYVFVNLQTSYPIKYSVSYPWMPPQDPYIGEVWMGYYVSRLPSKVKVYGTNEDPRTVDLSTCALLYTLDDDPSWNHMLDYAWCNKTDIEHYSQGEDCSNMTDSEFDAVEPIVLRMMCNYTGDTYRYLILVVEDTYDSYRYGGQEDNPYEYVTFDEIEVVVKAEEE